MDETEQLIKDLCARVPYNTIVSVADWEYDCTDCKNKMVWNKEKLTLSLLHRIEEEEGAWGFIKPYLRSMDDMTEEEAEEFSNMGIVGYQNYDWLNSRHFDYRNLIEKGLAIKAPKGMYKI